MASLAIPALEAAFFSLLVAVGVRAVDEVARRQRTVSQAGAGPLAQHVSVLTVGEG
jgi:hypothetical protein